MTELQPLTDRQRECLDILIEAALHGEPPPTMREISESMGIKSTNGVNDHLKALERKGYIDRDGDRSRGVRVIGLWPDAPVRAKPARVYTFATVSDVCDWAETIGSGFQVHTTDSPLTYVVTRVKS